MPRYRVVLEFDHPGQEGLLNAPDKWRWSHYLPPEATDIDATTFEQVWFWWSQRAHGEYAEGER